MCVCFHTLKCVREQSTPDALWAYDPGKGSTSTARWARHAVGPAPSLQSCVGYRDISNTFGAVFDKTGYISTVFSLTGLSTSNDPISAWNGTDTAWFYNGSSWYAFDLSGNQLTSSRYDNGSRFHVACNSDGDLIAFNYFTAAPFIRLQRRTRSGTVAASINPFFGTCPLAVDSSGNVIAADLSSLVKYNSSLSSQWSKAYPSSGDVPNAIVCDSSSNTLVLLTQASPGTTVKISQYNSSGTVQWTTTTGFNALYDSLVDFWCDGSNVYLAMYANVGSQTGMIVKKYNSSGTEQWARNVWYDNGTTAPQFRSLRADGSLMALAGTRGQ